MNSSSVSIGYATGGGQGEATPWVGLGVDDVLSYDIVLYDGTFVTANATSHSDLYWALRGGGSGFGVITSLETAVIGVPEESSGGFTIFRNSYKQTEDEAREFFKRFQDFLVPDLPYGSKKYKDKIRSTSARFGGAGSYSMDPSSYLFFIGLFLGSKDEFNSTFGEAGLLDPEILADNGHVAAEFSFYADAELFSICKELSAQPHKWIVWTYASYVPGEGSDICEELGIDSTKYCHESGFFDDPFKVPNCDFYHESFDLDGVMDAILPALKDVAIKPQSWFNRPGQRRLTLNGNDEDTKKANSDSNPGGLLIGRLDPDILLEIANVGADIAHFAHGKLFHEIIHLHSHSLTH